LGPGGGNRLSMLHVLDEAYKIGMLNNGTVDDPAEAARNKLTVGDDRAIDQTWVMGRQVYQRSANSAR